MFINKAVLKNDILITLDDKDDPIDIIDLSRTRVGQVHKARVEKVLKDIDGCILNLYEIGEKGFIMNSSLKSKDFIIRHSDKKAVCQADEFYVQIKRDKKDTKPFTCEFISDAESSDDCLNYFLDLLGISVEELSSDVDDIYYFPGLIEKALSRHIYLKNDANIIVDHTAGMNVIDVNTGQGYRQKDKFETNKLALLETAKQIRLKNLSGIIVVDLLKDMSKEEQKQLIDIFKDAVQEDYLAVNTFGFTRLGLFEITRERMLSPLYEIFEK